MKGKIEEVRWSHDKTSFTIYIIYIYISRFIFISFSPQLTSSRFLKSLVAESKLHSTNITIVYPTKKHPTQPTRHPNPTEPKPEPNRTQIESSWTFSPSVLGQERMKYIEKVLGDSAEEHAKLLAKQKKETFSVWGGKIMEQSGKIKLPIFRGDQRRQI